jgi:hypothetical protein
MHALTSVVLVVATLAIGLGLGAVTTSLPASLPTPGEPAQNQPAVVMAGGTALAVGPDRPSLTRVQPRVMPVDRNGAPALTSLPPVSTTGPWKSPLYPQNGVTVWDRIRVSTQRDRRAFLLGTAIQIHAGAAGESPLPS